MVSIAILKKTHGQARVGTLTWNEERGTGTFVYSKLCNVIKQTNE